MVTRPGGDPRRNGDTCSKVNRHRIEGGKSKAIAQGRQRKPVREYLLKQGRFAHFTEGDFHYFQQKIDEMWERWLIPGVCAFDLADDIKKSLAKSEVEVGSAT